MSLLLELPATSASFVLLARKNGQYIRPIIGFTDIRLESMGFPPFINTLKFIARLPNINKYGVDQVNKYLKCYDSIISIIDQTEANELNYNQMWRVLPHEPSMEYWEYTNAPWWEFAAMYDKYNGCIKAPLVRLKTHEDPTPEEIDERLDEFPENHHRIRVISPINLIRNRKRRMLENYTYCALR